MSLAIYKKNIHQILRLKTEKQSIENSNPDVNINLIRISKLKNDIKKLDLLIGGTDVNPNKIQELILSFVLKNDYPVKIVNIDNVHSSAEGDFNIYTYNLEIQGNYDDLIMLCYEFEKNFKYSRLSSVKFYKQSDYKNQRDVLLMKIILQNYESTTD